MRPELRRARLARARLYVCTPSRPDLDQFVRAVLAAGVDVVQLRDKTADLDDQRRAAEVCRRACDDHDALFIVNDSPELAVATGADGVHVGQDDDPPQRARAVCGEEMLVGLSTHSRSELSHATKEPVDYLGVGPVHATPTKPGRPGVGLDYVRAAAEAATVPWFVTGGMDAGTIPEAIAAGADRFVVVRAITEAPDPGAEARRIRALIG